MICGGVPVRQHKTNAETILRCGTMLNECVGDAYCCANVRSMKMVSRETMSWEDRAPDEA